MGFISSSRVRISLSPPFFHLESFTKNAFVAQSDCAKLSSSKIKMEIQPRFQSHLRLFKTLKMKKTLYLIDGSAYVYRNFHAIRNLSNSKGFPTNAIFGFTNTLIKLLESQHPEYLAVSFDMKGKTFRNDIYKDYKANRPPMPDALSLQIPIIEKIVTSFNIPIIKKERFEADDIIGTIAKRAEEKGFNVVMVTGDKDFLQLISENISILDPMKNKVLNMETLKKETQLVPNQIIDMMALSGDTSDNIPGAKGIGVKTAIALIQEFGTLETLYENIETITKKKQKENLVQDKEKVFLSKNLVTIDTNVSINLDFESFKKKAPNKENLYKIFKEFEFKKLQETFFVSNKEKAKKTYKLIETKDELLNLCKKLKEQECFAVDTETTSEVPMNAKLVGISFSFSENSGFYIPFSKDFLSPLKEVIENEKIKKIGHNIKYDKIVLKNSGIDLKGIFFDTMLASYLLNPSKRAHSLSALSLDFFDYKMVSFKEVLEKSNAKNFSEVSLKDACFYSSEDADITFCLYNKLEEALKNKNLTSLFCEIEMPLIDVLVKMEMEGIKIDEDKLSSLSKTFASNLDILIKKIYEEAGEEFNINSPKQLGKILFEKLKLPVQKKTKKKTGYSTDIDVLTALINEHNLPSLLLEYRSLAKLKSTYTDTIINLLNPETKRLHTSYNQTITATGRLSSSNPNLQNIPVKTDIGRKIREGFISKKNNILISADYSQIELRILAHYSKDIILTNAFKNDDDIHLRTAIEIFGAIPDLVDNEMRRQAKAVNFGIVYGISPFGLSKQLSITQRMAKTFIEKYFERYRGVKTFIDTTIEKARKTQTTKTLYGRIREIPDINAKNHNIRLFNERVAINTPIQGTAADIIKLAMIKTDNEYKKKELKTKMLLSVHDELIFEVPIDEEELAKNIIKNSMEKICKLEVPLKVNISFGKSWGELK